jgi:hypothetical protein
LYCSRAEAKKLNFFINVAALLMEGKALSMQRPENRIRNGPAPLLEGRALSSTAAQQSPENRISFSENETFIKGGKIGKKIKITQLNPRINCTRRQ